MKLRILIIITSFVCLCDAVTHTAIADISQELNTKITHMINSNLPDASVGVTVQDAVTGKILYDYRAGKQFLPASTTKLFTTAAALKLLGPDYCYDTTLYYNQSVISSGEYKGDIALKFSGDPSLQLASLYSLLQKLSDAHIKVIKGNFLIDDTIFSGPLWALGWTLDSAPWYHAAPVSAIIIDRNQFGVTLFPSSKVGGHVAAKLDPEYPSSRFRSIISDVRAVTFEDSEHLCQIVAEVDEKNNLDLGGCWPIGNEPVYLRLAIKNPRLQAVQLISEALQKLDIKITGKIIFAPVPDNVFKLAHHSSEPLSVLIKPILAESNNLYAESLTKTLGARMFGVGSFKTGAFAVQKVLSDTTGIDFTHTRILDGSGESRYNLITPRHLMQLLYVMRSEKYLAKHFRTALAISGMNGTLQNRFPKLLPQVQAKTGTLSGVSTLAGYFTTHAKHELIIVIMINHALESNVLLKQFENELCYFLVEQL